MALLGGCDETNSLLWLKPDHVAILAVDALADEACACDTFECAAEVAAKPVPALDRPPGSPASMDELVLSGDADPHLMDYLSVRGRLDGCLEGSEVYVLWNSFRAALGVEGTTERGARVYPLLSAGSQMNFMERAGRILEEDEDADPDETLHTLVGEATAAAPPVFAALKLDDVQHRGDEAMLELHNDAGETIRLTARRSHGEWGLDYDPVLMGDHDAQEPD